MWKQGLEPWGLYSFPARDAGRHCSFLLAYSFRLFLSQLQSVCVSAPSLQSYPTLCNSMGCSLPGSVGFSDKNTGLDSHALLQGIFPGPETKLASPVSLALQADSLKLSHWGSSQLQRLPCKKWRNWGKNSEGLFESLGLWSHSFLWSQKSDLSGRGEFSL